jgi:hypothetical protein
MIKFKQFSVLLEKDNRSKIVKFLEKTFDPQVAEAIANVAHSWSDKHSITLANLIANDIIDKIALSGIESNSTEAVSYMLKIVSNFSKDGDLAYVFRGAINLLAIQKKPNIDYKKLNIMDIDRYWNAYNHIKRWIEESGEFDTTLSWGEAKAMADEWYESLSGHGLQIKDRQEILEDIFDGETFIKIDNKELYWLDLNSTYCRDEGAAAGHCGNAETGTLFSLRTRDGVPKITADIDINRPLAGQIYGHANTKPKDKYHKAILYLLGYFNIEKVTTRNYKQESFNPDDDLSEELKEWYEDKFKLELVTGGISKSDWDYAEQTCKEFNKNDPYVWMDIEEADYDEAEASVSIGATFSYENFDLLEDDNLYKHLKDVFGYGYDSDRDNGNEFRVDYSHSLDVSSYFSSTHQSHFTDWVDELEGEANYYRREYEKTWKEGLAMFIKEGYIEFSSPAQKAFAHLMAGLVDDPLPISKNITHEFQHAEWTWEDPNTLSVQFGINIAEVMDKYQKKILSTDAKKQLLNYLNKKDIINSQIFSRIYDDPNQLKFSFMDESSKLTLLINHPWSITAHDQPTWGYIYLTKYISLTPEYAEKAQKNLYEAYKIDLNFNKVQDILLEYLGRLMASKYTKLKKSNR